MQTQHWIVANNQACEATEPPYTQQESEINPLIWQIQKQYI